MYRGNFYVALCLRTIDQHFGQIFIHIFRTPGNTVFCRLRCVAFKIECDISYGIDWWVGRHTILHSALHCIHATAAAKLSRKLPLLRRWITVCPKLTKKIDQNVALWFSVIRPHKNCQDTPNKTWDIELWSPKIISESDNLFPIYHVYYYWHRPVDTL